MSFLKSGCQCFLRWVRRLAWGGLVVPAVFCGAMPRCAAAPAGTQWALLIGVEKYENPMISPLRFAVSDVKALGEALVEVGFPKEKVLVMTSDLPRESPLYPTNMNVMQVLSDLAKKVQPEDTFLFFFSGH
ncbi:MAG: caspase family protein, partial [Armatimonadota bacterium]|nr:caspase family protein [Armatimonadota bacterium]